ncbi:hypothetical protein UK23_30975 [Lentzea aerocolonigenes]|uniref:Uncharacterized protein n=1 Tax=Lentzea aerocolonigenes TaxID=68170 RepID=A0A0F0GRK7_LENAE|nr:hypothetical protein UK23_30975 [Lentzea aerocolonigenes]
MVGETVKYEPLLHHDFRVLGFPAAVELGKWFQYYTEFPDHILSRRDAALTREIVPTWLTLEDFLAAHREEITVGQ